MFWCWIGQHKWHHVSVNHYRDISYCKPGEYGAESSRVTSVCEKCNAIKSKSYYGAGFLNLNDLNRIKSRSNFNPTVINGGKK